MSHSFESIDELKRIEIINNGHKEFAEQGYKRSSLNNILKNSNISKGFFYHYFKNKEEFYNYLVDFSIDIVVEKMNEEKILDERDYIKRLQTQALHKIELAFVYPKLFEFLVSYHNVVTPEVYYQKVAKMSGDFMQRFLYENIDYSLFKDDIPKEILIKVIGRYNNQILEEISKLPNMKTMEDIVPYYNEQLAEIRQILYKKGI
jgi:AcrR family transcriptional regulator